MHMIKGVFENYGRLLSFYWIKVSQLSSIFVFYISVYIFVYYVYIYIYIITESRQGDVVIVNF